MKTATIITVGRKTSSELASLVASYEKRMNGWLELSWQYISPETGKMSRDEQRNRESKRILGALPKNSYVVLLDERGEMMNNHNLAQKVDEWVKRDQSLCVIIGGAFGVSEELRSRADTVWSLSSLVFPHEITRLILAEQLYRSKSISENSPYHHN